MTSLPKDEAAPCRLLRREYKIALTAPRCEIEKYMKRCRHCESKLTSGRLAFVPTNISDRY